MGLQFYNLGKITHDTMTMASYSPREKPGIFQNEKHWQSFAGVVGKLHGLVLTQQCWQCFAPATESERSHFRYLLNSYDDKNWDWPGKGFF